jgi:hypothetical protein
MHARRRLELSLTHKNGRLNEDFYLDQNEKIELFLHHYLKNIATLTLHDGTHIEIEAKMSVVHGGANVLHQKRILPQRRKVEPWRVHPSAARRIGQGCG